MIERVLDKVFSDQVEALPARCIHTSPSGSDCRACVDVCSAQAIELAPLRIAKESCDGCDGCVMACPAGAIRPSVRRRGALLAGLARASRGVPATFTCREAPASSDSIVVNCVAALDPWSPVVALLVGASHIELRHGDCAGCGHDEGLQRRCAAAAAAVDLVGQALGLAPGCVQAASPPPEATVGAVTRRRGRRTDRRGLLSGWLRTGSRTTARVVAAVAPAAGDEQPAELSDVSVRDLAATLLASSGLPSTPIAGGVLGGRPWIADGCTRCGACAASCHEGALTMGPLGAKASAPGVRLFAARCTGCGSCAVRCPERVLTVEPVLDLAECGRRPIELVSELRSRCVRCGEAALASFLPVCARCYKGSRGLASRSGHEHATAAGGHGDV